MMLFSKIGLRAYNQGMAHDQQTKARAIALLTQGFPPYRIEQMMLKEGFHVTDSTIAVWRENLEIAGIIRTTSQQLAMRAGSFLNRALDQIEDTGDYKKYLVPFNIIMGTAQDKLLAESRAYGPNQGSNTYILIQEPRTITITDTTPLLTTHDTT